jgi:arylsulfatase A-like enzyme/tetratricopeptide (TPR) repeat protein
VSRRRTIVGAVLAVAAAALLLAGWYQMGHTAARLQPAADRNVLLVTIDTLRADALGTYGGRAVTPNLDALAAAGTRFDFAHAHAVVTLPSHASILSGRYPYEHGVRDNTGYRFPPATPTAATLLKAQGFATGAFIGGFPLVRQFGLAAGFDHYDDRLGRTGGERSEGERAAPVVIASARDWIGSQTTKWFAWVHLYDPHTPYAPAGEWAARFRQDPYLGEVSATDAALGVLLARVRAEGRPTLVIVTSDHGESLGEHGEPTHGTFAYEATLRVPLVVAVIDPRVSAVRPSVTTSTPARHVDLLPTMLDLVQAPEVPSSGRSLRGVINGAETDDRPSYFEAMTAAVSRGWAPLRGVIVDRDKYIDLPIPELYDLTSDPREATNLAATRDERTRVLFNVLRGFDVAPPGRAQAEDAATLERLRSLGYVGGGSVALKERYTEADDPKRLITLEAQMAAAAEAFASGRMDDAVRIYEEVIRARADMEDAYRKLALVYWRTGRPQLAVGTLESALKAGITQGELILKLGQYLAESGQPAKAIALLQGRAEDDPDALIVLGNAYAYAGRPADAARTFARVLALNPDDAVAHENLGAMQLQQGDYVSAEKSLRRAIELDPGLAGAHTALGVLLANTGRREEAIAAWTRALELDPADENARHNLAAVRRQH